MFAEITMKLMYRLFIISCKIPTFRLNQKMKINQDRRVHLDQVALMGDQEGNFSLATIFS